jgi:peptidyl-prolyl cis-trans isomerase A (cyclophilin A)
MKGHAIACLCLVLAGCATQPEAKKEAAAPEPQKKTVPNPLGTPDVYKAKFVTSKGPFVIEVHREWAPRGADRFYELIKEGYYNDARFFRVIPNFVAQWGLAASPAITKKWDKPIDDDPVGHTNSRGTVTFATAGRNSRTTQVFINLRSNQTLDDQGFAAFGQVVEGMDNVDKIYGMYGDTPDQEAITRRGNSYLKSSFPLLDYIRSATIL